MAVLGSSNSLRFFASAGELFRPFLRRDDVRVSGGPGRGLYPRNSHGVEPHLRLPPTAHEVRLGARHRGATSQAGGREMTSFPLDRGGIQCRVGLLYAQPDPDTNNWPRCERRGGSFRQ